MNDDSSNSVNGKTWQAYLHEGITGMLAQPSIAKVISDEHRRSTPARVVKAFTEVFWGVDKDPRQMILTSFEEDKYDQMVIVADVEFTSWCAHHLLPFIGTWSFAYLPDKKIVGLSKIPRMIEIFAARPQVQESLSEQIVDMFQELVQPRGCGLVMDAKHTCMCTRGVKKTAITRTTALRGAMIESGIKAEFLAAVGPIPKKY